MVCPEANRGDAPPERGRGKHHIQYRHIIDWLMRKPGAFENYKYRAELFPTHRFRVAYDQLKRRNPLRATREYLEILHLAARETESGVDAALGLLIDQEEEIAPEAVRRLLREGENLLAVRDVNVSQVNLDSYDGLLERKEVAG